MSDWRKMTWQQAVTDWKNNETVWAVEMGGLGPVGSGVDGHTLISLAQSGQ